MATPQDSDHWLSLGKSNKERYAESSSTWASEANQSDRHLSSQLTTAASLFITVGAGFFALAKEQLSLDERIFVFTSLMFFSVSLISGIVYSFQLTSFFEKASLLTSECDGVWSSLVRSQEEYNQRNSESNAIMDRLSITSPRLGLHGQVTFLILGLLFSFFGIFLYLFI